MRQQAYDGEVVWIIGASSGIGAALAAHLSSLGARVAVSARRAEALAQVAETSQAEWILPLDVTEVKTLRDARERLVLTAGRIDRVIFLSGSYSPMNLDKLDLEQVRNIVDINLLGAYNLIHEIYPYLLAQAAGQLSLCASISGYGGLPHSQPYASTKAAMINMAESLRTEASGTGVDIKLINPGFVRTPLTDKNEFEMPFIMEPEAAAERIALGLRRSAFEIVFPRRFAFMLRLLSRLPYWLRFRLMKKGLDKL